MVEPRPSLLARQVDVLLALLAGTTEAEEQLLPAAPLPVGALTVRMDGGRVYRWSGGMVVGAVPVACAPCGTLPGGTVLADGPEATYICPNGHRASPGLLSAPHVRVAVAHGLDPRRPHRSPAPPGGRRHRVARQPGHRRRQRGGQSVSSWR
nr:hypothetical protein KitaXyl93_76740 [Kitasatospora sp. Xyl93]